LVFYIENSNDPGKTIYLLLLAPLSPIGYKMGKRLAIFLFIILISAIAVLGYLFFQSRKGLLTDPYKAISPGACLVIETVDLKSFLNSLTSGQGFFGEVGNIKELKNFNRKLKFLADQVNKPEYKPLLTEGTTLISFYPDKKQKLQPLLSAAVSGTLKNRHIKELFLSTGAKEVVESRTGDISILKILYIYNNQADTIFISLQSGLILCSTSEELIREAAGTISSGNDIRSLNGFMRVFMASGKREDKVFVVSQ
jgi:hypothetical protein